MTTLLYLLLYILVGGLVLYLIYWVAGMLISDAVILKIIKVILAVVAIIYLIYLVSDFFGYHSLHIP